MTDADLLALYIQRGLRLVYWERHGSDPRDWKGPRANGWNDPSRPYPPEGYNSTRMNVGMVTGHEIAPGKFAADVDFDWPEGLDLARKLIPSTGFAFGRKGKKISHAIFTTPDRLGVIKYCDYGDDGKGDGVTFVELRGGDSSHQTMIAPSLHSTDVRIELVLSGEILHVETARLCACTLDYAIACLLLKRIPGGFHHDGRKALAGYLLLAGLSPDRATAIIEEVCAVQVARGVHEMTSKDIGDAALCVRSTVKRLGEGKTTEGGPKFADWLGGSLGKHVLARLNKFIGREDDFARDGKGNILPRNQGNVARAIDQLGHTLSYNEFSDRLLVDGEPMEDRQVNDILTRIEIEFRFQPPESYFERVIKFLAWQHTFHPVKDYLNSLTWDGVPRIDTWLIDTADVEDSDYTRAVSSIMLVAAVRRIRQPGCKYDEMVVWETPRQGTDKSSAARALCPDPTWFSDDLPLNVDSKQMIEKTLGKWIIEAAELSGKRKTEIEQLKATLSRQVDGPARMAYAHFAVERPRHFILIGTTNSRAYLLDSTGARRFWPMEIRKRFDVEWIKTFRDQLWAEASVREATGESIRLDESLWAAAEVQQESRREIDPWEDLLRNGLLRIEPKGDGRRRIPSEALWSLLNIPAERRDRVASLRISEVMQRLGFKRTTVRENGEVQTGYVGESPELLDRRGEERVGEDAAADAPF